MTRQEKVNLILEAVVYRSSNDSVNGLYMGSMQGASLARALGAQYGKESISQTLERATDEQLDAGLEVVANIVRYMADNPRSICPCCGAIVLPTTGEAT